MINYFAGAVFKEGTPNLLWGFPIGIPLLLFVYSPFILLLLGLILYLRARATKRRTETAVTVLTVGGYFLLWFLVQKYIPGTYYPLGFSSISGLHIAFTLGLLLAILLLYLRARATKKHTEAMRVMLIVAASLIALYAIEILGLIGAANS